MSDKVINGIRFIESSSSSGVRFVVERTIVDGRKIPDLTINISNTSALIDVDTALRLVAESLTTESRYLSNGSLVLSNTGQFYAKSYDNNESGSINFTDIGKYRSLFGSEYTDTEPLTLGNFTAPSTILGIGDEFIYNIDVPLLTDQIYQKEIILDNIAASGSYPLSTVNLARENLISNQFTLLTAHELGGHGLNVGVGHKKGGVQTLIDLSYDPAVRAEWEDAFNVGAFYISREGKILGKSNASATDVKSQFIRDEYRVYKFSPDKSVNRKLFDSSFEIIENYENGEVYLTVLDIRYLGFDPRNNKSIYSYSGFDQFDRRSTKIFTIDPVTGDRDYTGRGWTTDGDLTVIEDPINGTSIRLTDSPINIDFVDAAQIISGTLGRFVAGGDILTEVVSSAILNTISSNFGDVLNTIAFDSGAATSHNLEHAFDGIDTELLQNLKAAGIGAVSSYLTAQLIDVLGIDGLPAEILNTAAGKALNTIISNLAGVNANPFNGVGGGLANVGASFVGNKLASEIGNWDEVGEQIGSQIGSAIGAAIGASTIIGTAIGAFFGNLIGGLIGGVFTGAPKSGAILGYDEATGQFRVETVWKEDGGKRAVARQLGNTAATTLNGILASIGGELLNGDDVEAGSYGMRKKAFVYWNDGTSSDNRIKFSTASDLVEYGVMKAAQQMDIIGGDIYSKRAFYLTMARGAVTSSNGDGASADDGISSNNVDFGLDLLLGNFAVADRLKVYLANSASINALIAAEPDSVFTTDWLIALASASELGLLKRNEHDWDGGFSYLLDRGNVDARNVGFRFETSSRAGNGERVMYLDGAALEDTIDAGSKTIVQGGASDDVLTAYAGGARDGAAAGTAYHIANVFHGGDGDDRIVAGDTGDDLFGDSGNDLLVGGKLDDWLFGGAGNDVLDAGGGSGNVLIAGEGDDQLVGADGVSADPMNSGSDWLLGGLGNDRLYGLGGDDYFEGGQGSDFIEGAKGSDTIIFRAGDGTDRVSDNGTDEGDIDVIQFGDGIAPTDVEVIASSSSVDMSMLLGAGGDRIDLRGAALTSRAGIEFFDFGSTIWSRGQMTAQAIFAKNAGGIASGSGTGEIVNGTRYDDTLSGGSSDTLKGGYGSDGYQFALGDGEVTIDESGFASDLDVVTFATGISVADISVTINPASPQDLIVHVGNAGDRLILKHQLLDAGEGSLEEFRFVDGTSLTLRDLYGMALAGGFTAGADTKIGLDQPDRFLAGNGDDRLTGGLGNDNLEGGNGADTYVYRIGDGFDRIWDQTTDAWNGWLGGNTLELGAGITTSNITIERDPSDSNNVRIGISGQIGSILVDGQFDLATYGGNTYWGITTIAFADGTVWNRTAIDNFLVQSGLSQRNDIVIGTRADETINGGAGNDRLWGGDGADTIIGGQGDDTLEAGSAADTYVYNLGDGFDRVWDQTTDAWNGWLGGNTLQLGAGITTADIILERDQADSKNLRIRFGNGVGAVLVDNQYEVATYNGNTYWGITSIAFVDGTVWNRDQIEAQLRQASISSFNDTVYGTRSDEILDAGSGNDRVYADEGMDTITGGAGDDILEGGNGADTYIYNLGDGFDRIWDATTNAWNGGVGDNTLQLGAGITAADIILERDLADTNNLRVRFANGVGSVLIDGQYQLATYNGNTYWGITNIAFVDGTVWNRAAIEAQLLASSQSAQNDVVYGTRTNETIDGRAGNDTIFAGDGNDVIIGGTGDDVLQGGNGQDTYIYNIGDGDDVIIDARTDAYNNWFGSNTLKFGAGISSSDLILEKDFADNANLVIRFANATGSITVDDQTRAYWDASWGIDTFEFADGSTWDRATITAAITQSSMLLTGTNNGDELTGSASSETIRGLAGNDILAGAGGSDRLEGGDGNDTYLFNLGDGSDLIVDSSGSDTVRFGAGITTSSLILSQVKYDGDNDGVFITIAGTSDRLRIYGQNGGNRIERFEFADGTIWTDSDLRTHLFAQVLTAGDDVVRGTSFGDTLLGGAGDDQIQSVDGDDIIGGGAGSDRLEGGNGNDVYLFNLGDGFDVIVEAGGSDTVRFGAGIAASDLVLTQVNQDGDNDGVFVTVAGTNDRLHIVGQNAGNYRIERFEFADGTVWTDADFRAQLFAQLQTAGDDVVRGTGFVDVLTGGSGDDQLYGLDGNDTLGGGTGIDRLEGGNGDDIYLFNLGDGFDVIAESGGTDTVRFGAGISASNLILTQVNQDGDNDGVFITVAGTNDRLHIIGQNAGNYTIERFEFADGTVWTSTQLRERLFAQISTGGDDVIRGSSVADVLDGQGGDDQIYGLDGNDTLTGGKGSDRLEGGNGNDIYIFNRGDGGDTIWDSGGNDTIRFGPGIAPGDLEFTQALQDGDSNGVTLAIKGTNDRLHIIGQAGGSLIERFEFFDGTVWTGQTLTDLRTSNIIGGQQVAVTMGDDTIVGTSGADTIRGMGGDDALRGGMGSDTYRFARGDGFDTIYDPDEAAATDVLILDGINSGDVAVMGSPTDPDDIILYIDDQSIVYLDQNRVGGKTGIDEIRFADGAIWDRATLLAKASGGQGTVGNDLLIGSNFADTLTGGTGDDRLVGGAGNDIYIYNAGDGHDVIVDMADNADPAAATGNVLSFGPGITLADIRLTRNAVDGPLIIGFAGQAGSVTLEDSEADGLAGVQFLKFADGSVHSMADVRQAALTGQATSGNDLIEGFSTADTLTGGAGNDTLIGRGGADTYHFALGDGEDTIIESDGAANKLVFGTGIATTSLRLYRTIDAPDDLIIALPNGTDRVVLKDQLSSSGRSGVARISFADGTVWDRGEIIEQLLSQPATPYADYLVGSDAADNIDGLAGDDFIEGGQGNDILAGSDGNDILFGGIGNDVLHGGEGDDILSGDEGVDRLDGGNGFDTADYSFSLDSWNIDLAAGTASIIQSTGTGPVETLISIEAVVGGLGSDRIKGSDVANQIRGGAGNDILEGRGEDDVFIVEGDEEGIDAIDGGAGYDRIEAAADDTVIGLSSLANVELITANGHANVRIEGTDENDVLDLSAAELSGIVSIDLGAGNDILTGTLGADTINAGAGDDVIRYVGQGAGADVVDGGDGTDRIEAAADNATIRLASYQNIEAISGGQFSGVVLARTDAAETTNLNGLSVSGLSRIDLEGGDDIFVGTAQAETVRGGSGNDTLSGNAGDDIFDYVGVANGIDTISGGDGFDTIRASADNTRIGISSLTSIERLAGNGHANVVVEWGAGNDVLNFSTVTLDGLTLETGAGNDSVTLNGGGIALAGGTGNDTFTVSGNGGHTFKFGAGDGNDTLTNPGSGYARSDMLQLNALAPGDVSLIRSGDQLKVTIAATGESFSVAYQFWNEAQGAQYGLGGITFADGTVWNRTQIRDHALILGTTGNDSITLPALSYQVRPGTGDDTLTVQGSGFGTVEFSKGDGHDVLNNPGSGYVRNDTLYLKDVLPNEVSLVRVGDSLTVTINSTGDTFKATYQFWTSSAEPLPHYGINRIKFADGTVWNRSEFDAPTVPFTSGNDSIQGTNNGEMLRGGAGDDVINALAGNDTIYGDEGNDTIDSGTGNDLVAGGTGNDTILETSGDDTYVWNRGDGNDRLQGGGNWDGYNVLQLGDGIVRADLSFSRVGTTTDIRMSVAGDGGSFTFADGLNIYGDAQTDVIRFADGSTMTHAEYAAAAAASQGTVGNDSIYGSRFNDVIEGGAGDDVIDANVGNDTIRGGAGNNTILETSGDDTYVWNRGDGNDRLQGGGNWDGYNVLQLGAGIARADLSFSRVGTSTDIKMSVAGESGSFTFADGLNIYGDAQVDVIRFVDGSTMTHAEYAAAGVVSQSTAGNDNIYGSRFNDVIEGGAGDDVIDANVGNDTIRGGAGNNTILETSGDDTYLWNRGDGNDRLQGGGNWDGYNVLQLGVGIARADLSFSRVGTTTDIKMSVAGEAGSFTFADGLNIYGDAQVDVIRFADGSTMTHAEYAAAGVASQSTAGNDSIYGSRFNDVIEGGAGDDVIDANVGNDTIRGGAGNNTILETSGDDTYIWNRGDGNDRLQGGGNWDGYNVLQLGAGIARADLSFSRVGTTTDIKMSVAGESGSFTFADGLNIYGDAQADVIRFADGSTMTHAEYAAAAATSQGTAGNDSIYGSRFNDVIEGGAGDDVIDANLGNDTIRGGAGNDTIFETSGDDTYVWNRGDGVSTIRNYGSWDGYNSLAFGSGIAQSDVFIWFEGTDVRIGVEGEAGSITLVDQRFASEGIDRILFADGSSWDRTTFKSRAIAATSQSEMLFGTENAESLRGLGGDDRIMGLAGDDILKGEAGNDVLYGDGLSSTGSNLIVNGSFEEQGTNPSYQSWGVWLDAIPGWTKSNSGRYNQTKSGFSNIASTNGQYYLDMDDAGQAGGNMDIRQTIGGLTAGETMLLSFDHANSRQSASGFFNVYWNGQKVASITDISLQMQTSSIALTAVAGNNELRFQATGAEDGLGAALDNVRLTTAAQSTSADTLIGGTGNDYLDGGMGNDTLEGGDGNDMLVGDGLLPVGSNLIVNGSFESLGPNPIYQGWGVWSDVMPGWTKTNVGRFNQVNSGNDGAYATDGQYLLDLDDAGQTGSNMDVRQTVGGLSEGQALVLTFDHGNPRNSSSGFFEVYWNDQLIATITDLGAQMRSTELHVIATSGDNVLRFQGIGAGDAVGGQIDNVQLFATQSVGAGNDILTGGAGNDRLDGGAGLDTAVFAGAMADYAIITTNGAITVTDSQPSLDGDDGTDTLIGIETASFKDTSINLAAPIVLDLNGDGVTLVDNKRTKVGFDWKGDGIKNQTGWIGKDDGFLFIDRDGNGTVTDAGELSFTSDKDGAKSDLDGLRTFDSNGDGIFSSADDQFSQFKVWRDKNGNGRVDNKEILSLQAAGVASIDLTGEAVNQSWEWGENITVNTGSFTRTNGTVSLFSDVALSYDTASSQNAAISTAASQLSQAMAGFWDGRGTAAFGKFEALAERGDNFLAVARGGWR